jgi:K(+)-stimulated pyrophosphate-energized sodium pump
MNPIIKFTTLFGLLAVELAEGLRKNPSLPPSLTLWLAGIFFVIALAFIYRSFYGMRIGSHMAEAAEPAKLKKEDELELVHH